MIRQSLSFIYEQIPGGSAQLVAQQSLQNLAMDQAVTVMFERPW